MSLFDKITQDLKAAMLNKEKDKLEALRAIKAALLNAKTEKGAKELTEADELRILQKLVKQRQDSAALYKEQNRQDLYENEIKEATVIETYLPKLMSEEEIKTELQKIIASVGAETMKDMGKVMGAATKAFAGKADNKLVADLVRQLLA